MNKTIKDLSELELKAACYDNFVQIQKLQAIINACETELVNRNKEQLNPQVKEVIKETDLKKGK